MYRRARALEQAQQHSASFESNIVAAVTEFNDTNSHENISVIQKEKKVSYNESKELCYFCGNWRHARSICPAREAVCRKCSKKGHWAKVCRSPISAAIPSPSNDGPNLA